MVQLRADLRERSDVRPQNDAQPQTGQTHVVRHVHAIRAIERPREILQTGVVIQCDVVPQASLHFSSHSLQRRRGAVRPPETQSIQIHTVISWRVVLPKCPMLRELVEYCAAESLS